MKKLVSVIIPIYQVEIYLRKCINTVINQTYSNLQIILVDDGSTDDSGKICDAYVEQDTRIEVIHKTNGGLSDARNAGIDIAKGEYITFIDSDDYIDENYIAELYGLAEEHKTDITIANRYEVKEDKVINTGYYKEFQKKMISKELLQEFFYDKIPHEAWGKLYRKEIFNNNTRYQYGLRIFEDLEFIYDVLLKSNITIYCDTSKYLYYYRDRDDSLMKTNFDEYWKKELDFYHKIWQQLEDKRLKKALSYVYAKVCIRNFDIIFNQNSFDNKRFKDELKQIKSHLKIIKHNAYQLRSKKSKIKVFLIRNMSWFLTNYRKGKMGPQNKFLHKFDEYLKKQRQDNQKLYLIFNGPTTGNIGDHAILFAEEEVLKKEGKEPFSISAKEMQYFFSNNREQTVLNSDKIFITGGGNIGTLWRNEQIRINKVLDIFRENEIIIFPQTVYYANNEFGKMCLEIDKQYYYESKNLLLYCRDETSYLFVKEQLQLKTQLIKDIALSLDYKNLNFKRKGIVFCLRNDKEKTMTQEQQKNILEEMTKRYPSDTIKYKDTLQTNRKEYTYQQGKKEFLKIIREFSKSKIVVTDRLHGMIFAIVTGTPCIAFNNSSGKVKGVYETIKNEVDNLEFRELKK